MELVKEYFFQIIVGLIAGSIIPTIITVFANRRKSKADEASTLTGTALQLVNEMQEELARMKSKVQLLDEAMDKNRCDLIAKGDRIASLERQLDDKEIRIRFLELQLAEKDARITELQANVASKEQRIDALEKRIKELEEAEKRYETNKGSSQS